MADISLAQARRIVLAAQGFGARGGAPVGRLQLGRVIDRLSLHQIDSVNVVARAHYLPAFSRLGRYDRDLLDTAAWAASATAGCSNIGRTKRHCFRSTSFH